jgi:antitoxin YefM
MHTVTFSEFKIKMESTIQQIVETHQPVVVKKNRCSSVVVMPLEDYQALTETKYLLNSQANAARLVRGIEEIEDLIARGGK